MYDAVIPASKTIKRTEPLPSLQKLWAINLVPNNQRPKYQRPVKQHLWSRLFMSFFIITSLCLLLVPSFKQPANAQSGNISLSYVTPFPVGGTYKVLVIGDGYAEGAWLGLKAALKDNKKIELFREVTYRAGLIKRGRTDWVSKIDSMLNKRGYDMAILMIGLQDRRSINIDGQKFEYSEDGWRLFYKRRVKEVIRKFKTRKVSLYWVGMPIVGPSNFREYMQRLNSIIQNETTTAQIRYIDHWLQFANENGEYSQYGPDVDGKIRLLRRRDGIYFTKAGYEKLGYFINTFIQRDLRDAKAERNVPLLGDQADQKYLLRRSLMDSPKNRRKLAARQEEQSTDKKRSKAGDKLRSLTGLSEQNKYESARHSKVKLPADIAQSGKETEIKILRPAIPAAAFSIGRRASEIASENGQDNGPAILVEEIDDIIGFAIASATEQLTGADPQRRLPLTQTPYYKLLVRGEPQPALYGRADDFKWRGLPPAIKKESKPEATSSN